MNSRNNQTIVASSVRAIKEALLKGGLDNKAMSNINMFNMLDYYLDFMKGAKDNGFTGYDELHIKLTETTRKFTLCHKADICNYKIRSKRKYRLIDFTTDNMMIHIDTVDLRISQLQI
jgi:hypothetical protein